jgi:hypothetical protein
MRKQKYNPAWVEDEVSISDMLSEELDMASGDEMWKMIPPKKAIRPSKEQGKYTG